MTMNNVSFCVIFIMMIKINRLKELASYESKNL